MPAPATWPRLGLGCAVLGTPAPGAVRCRRGGGDRRGDRARHPLLRRRAAVRRRSGRGAPGSRARGAAARQLRPVHQDRRHAAVRADRDAARRHAPAAVRYAGTTAPPRRVAPSRRASRACAPTASTSCTSTTPKTISTHASTPTRSSHACARKAWSAASASAPTSPAPVEHLLVLRAVRRVPARGLLHAARRVGPRAHRIGARARHRRDRRRRLQFRRARRVAAAGAHVRLRTGAAATCSRAPRASPRCARGTACRSPRPRCSSCSRIPRSARCSSVRAAWPSSRPTWRRRSCAIPDALWDELAAEHAHCPRQSAAAVALHPCY